MAYNNLPNPIIKNGRVYFSLANNSNGTLKLRRKETSTTLASDSISKILPSYLNIDLTGSAYTSGIVRLDITISTDFNALNNIDKTPVQVTFSNSYGSNFTSDVLYTGKATMKVRGNTTATFPKKPYALSFVKDDGTDNKFALLGMYKDTDFVLLAEYDDPTYLRTFVCQEISRQLGSIAPKTFPLEIFVNGSYHGLYTITEKVKQSLIIISTLGTGASDQTQPNITGGYLLQKVLDVQEDFSTETSFKSTYYNDSYSGVVHINEAHSLVIEYPKFGKITTAQTDYIKQAVINAENSLSQPWSDKTKGASAFFDVNSLFNYLFVYEFSKSIDTESHSGYFYKVRNGKFFMGPAWDFDLAFPVYTAFPFDKSVTTTVVGNTPWYRILMNDSDFLADAAAYFNSNVKQVINNCISLFIAKAQLLIDSGALYRNNVKWGVNTTDYVISSSTNNKSNEYDIHFNLAVNFMNARYKWLSRQYYSPAPVGNPVDGYALATKAIVGVKRYTISGLSQANAVTVFIVASKEVTTPELMLCSIPTGDTVEGYPVNAANDIFYNKQSIGLNTYTGRYSNYPDSSVLNNNNINAFEFTIFNGRPDLFRMSINGIAGQLIIGGDGDHASRNFANTFMLGNGNESIYLWQGKIYSCYLYLGDMDETSRQQMRNYLSTYLPTTQP